MAVQAHKPSVAAGNGRSPMPWKLIAPVVLGVIVWFIPAPRASRPRPGTCSRSSSRRSPASSTAPLPMSAVAIIGATVAALAAS